MPCLLERFGSPNIFESGRQREEEGVREGLGDPPVGYCGQEDSVVSRGTTGI